MLRLLPKMDEILNHPEIIALCEELGKPVVTGAVRQAIEDKRKCILDGGTTPPDVLGIICAAKEISWRKLKRNLRKVINATGTVLHTNLGRSRLSDKAVQAVTEVAGNYSNLEYNLEKGFRGERYDCLTGVITELTGAEAALVVNNNAAAVLLVLSALAKGKRVIVSRGEQVEIGGMFRVPDIMDQSGSILVEVGTTNKTHAIDYEANIDENSVLLKVHTSNFKLIGFTEDVDIKTLKEIGERHNVPLIYDLGSGSLINFESYGILGEPDVISSVKDGADIICFSGDKLLGGPQAGIIIGKKAYIDIIKKHPLTRAFRVDKMTLVALEATILEYYDEKAAVNNIPSLKSILSGGEVVKKRAESLYNKIKSLNNDVCCDIVSSKGTIGGGSMPGLLIDSYCVGIKDKSKSVNTLEKLLRFAEVPVIARISDELLLIDMLTIDDEDLDYIASTIISIL